MKEKILNGLFWIIIILIFAASLSLVSASLLEPDGCEHAKRVQEQDKVIVEMECRIVALQSILTDRNAEIAEMSQKHWEMWSRIEELEGLMKELTEMIN